jgi:cyclase
MAYSNSISSRSTLITRREALLRGSFFLGGAVLGSTLLSRLGAQTPAAAALAQDSVERPDHPIAQMRQGMSRAPLTVEKVTDNHYAFLGHGGNVGIVVGLDGTVAIDSGSGQAPATEKLSDALKQVSDKPLRSLINTHWHFDHTDGNAHLHGLGATIIAHRAVRARMSTPQKIAFFNAAFPSSPRAALPTILFDDSLTLDLGDDVLQLQHVAPAHTDGDSFVHSTKRNVIHTGDLFFNGTFPFIDGGSGGSVDGMIAAGEKIVAIADDSTRIIPGHGAVCGKKDYLAFLDMLRTARERLGKLKAAGKNVDEAVAAKPLADLDEKWGKGFINGDAFTRLAYGIVKG